MTLRVQRGVITYGAAADSAVGAIPLTIVTSKSWGRLTNTRHSNAGRVGGATADLTNADLGEQFIFTTTQVTAARYASGENADHQVPWEIVEYIGAGGGANEFISRAQAPMNFADTDTDIESSAVAAIVDVDKCVVFLHGARNDRAASALDSHLFTASLTVDKEVRLRRGNGTGAASTRASLIEFTGSNWSVEYFEHEFAGTGLPETYNLVTPVASWDNAFIVAYMQAPTGEVDADETGCIVVPGTTVGTMRLLLAAGADAAGAGGYIVRGWVISNPTLNVHHNNTFPSVGGTAPPMLAGTLTQTYTLPAAVNPEKSFAFVYSNAGNTGVLGYPSAHVGYALNAGGTAVDLVRGRELGPVTYCVQVVSLAEGEVIAAPVDMAMDVPTVEVLSGIPPTFQDVNYRPAGSSLQQLMDVYVGVGAAPAEGRPTIINVLLAGFSSSTKFETCPFEYLALRAAGWTVIDAQVTFTHPTPLADPPSLPAGGGMWRPRSQWDIEGGGDDMPALDVAWIIQKVKQEAATYQVNPRRIYLAGRSASGDVVGEIFAGADLAMPSSAIPQCRQSTYVLGMVIGSPQSHWKCFLYENPGGAADLYYLRHAFDDLAPCIELASAHAQDIHDASWGNTLIDPARREDNSRRPMYIRAGAGLPGGGALGTVTYALDANLEPEMQGVGDSQGLFNEHDPFFPLILKLQRELFAAGGATEGRTRFSSLIDWTEAGVTPDEVYADVVEQFEDVVDFLLEDLEFSLVPPVDMGLDVPTLTVGHVSHIAATVEMAFDVPVVTILTGLLPPAAPPPILIPSVCIKPGLTAQGLASSIQTRLGSFSPPEQLEFIREALEIVANAHEWGFLRRGPVALAAREPVAEQSGVVWVRSAKTLYKEFAFISYAFVPGDRVDVLDGTGVVKRRARILSRDSDDQITIEDDLGYDASDLRIQVEIESILLPCDVEKVLALETRCGTGEVVLLTSEADLAYHQNARGRAAFGSYWCVVIDQDAADGGPPVKTLAFTPPAGRQDGELFTLVYQRAVPHIDSLASKIPVPNWLAPVVRRVVLAVAEGYRMEDAGEIEVRLEGIFASRLWLDAVERDTLEQPDVGRIQGGYTDADFWGGGDPFGIRDARVLGP